jgi:hypothetical protein
MGLGFQPSINIPFAQFPLLFFETRIDLASLAETRVHYFFTLPKCEHSRRKAADFDAYSVLAFAEVAEGNGHVCLVASIAFI